MKDIKTGDKVIVLTTALTFLTARVLSVVRHYSGGDVVGAFVVFPGIPGQESQDDGTATSVLVTKSSIYSTRAAAAIVARGRFRDLIARLSLDGINLTDCEFTDTQRPLQQRLFSD